MIWKHPERERPSESNRERLGNIDATLSNLNATLFELETRIEGRDEKLEDNWAVSRSELNDIKAELVSFESKRTVLQQVIEFVLCFLTEAATSRSPRPPGLIIEARQTNVKS